MVTRRVRVRAPCGTERRNAVSSRQEARLCGAAPKCPFAFPQRWGCRHARSRPCPAMASGRATGTWPTMCCPSSARPATRCRYASRALPRPPGSSRVLPGPPGSSRTLPGPPGPSRTLSDPPGSFWVLPRPAARSRTLLRPSASWVTGGDAVGPISQCPGLQPEVHLGSSDPVCAHERPCRSVPGVTFTVMQRQLLEDRGRLRGQAFDFPSCFVLRRMFSQGLCG